MLASEEIFPKKQMKTSPPAPTAMALKTVQRSSRTRASYHNPDLAAYPGEVAGFVYFSQLPAELRIRCWQLALTTEPRTILLHKEVFSNLSGRGTNFSRRFPSFPAKRVEVPRRSCLASDSCPREVSVLLRVCRESRTEVLNRYAPLLDPPADHVSRTPLFYFNPQQDGLYVDSIWPWTQAQETPTGLFQCRQLNIHCNAWHDAWHNAPRRLFGKRGLLGFQNLERLVIIFRVVTDAEYNSHEADDKDTEGSPQQAVHDSSCSMDLVGRMHTIELPRHNLTICREEIREVFGMLKRDFPTWHVPDVRIVGWAARVD